MHWNVHSVYLFVTFTPFNGIIRFREIVGTVFRPMTADQQLTPDLRVAEKYFFRIF